MRTPIRLRALGAMLTAGIAATAAAPAAAQDMVFTHPAELCIQQRADPVLGKTMIDLAIAAAGLDDGPTNAPEGIGSVLRPILTECLSQHGVPDRQARALGTYFAAWSTRNEARRRLEATAFDMAWLDEAIIGKQIESPEQAWRITGDLVDLMRLDPPEGLARDLTDGSEGSQMTRLLLYSYILGALDTRRLAASMRQ